MKRSLVCSAIVPALVFLCCSQTLAITAFYKEFRLKYLEENENEEFVKIATAAKCTICHDSKSKKKHNLYGRELVKLLDKQKDKADQDKIRKALETVAGLPIDPKDKKSLTFGDLIKKGKLPGVETIREK